MSTFIYILTSTVRFLIAAIQFLMMVRAVMSWLPLDDDNPILSFLYAVTEPVIMPVRYVVEYFGWFEGFPIDMSFLLTFILLSVIELFL